jgi:hypothetical protein
MGKALRIGDWACVTDGRDSPVFEEGTVGQVVLIERVGREKDIWIRVGDVEQCFGPKALKGAPCPTTPAQISRVGEG